MEDLFQQLKRHEGLRLKPYRDTVGKMTVGYGRNLEDRGISEQEAELMLMNDVLHFQSRLSQYSWFLVMNETRQGVIINMAYNLGMGGLLSFKRMIAALGDRNYTLAACEMVDSLWAKQVGNRAAELAEQMRLGWRIPF
ncbi:glycoside hydrolase family 24 [Nitrosococcus halophilus Nc 4]|uniref:Lysozyme n=1 Tax=Nitrosococcus halophilus (strain Nc4) TaxID=472759 RepID=D5BYV5_NITHN|nr:glycoside hydrolase family protein [Nitrosococcus halophilus]ADE14168.1 glycoside hydrolase family 24 [Nitrosococcus halophilus Nc 4]